MGSVGVSNMWFVGVESVKWGCLRGSEGVKLRYCNEHSRGYRVRLEVAIAGGYSTKCGVSGDAIFSKILEDEFFRVVDHGWSCEGT